MFSQGHILAAVFGTITTVLWALQVLGGAFLYKRVRVTPFAIRYRAYSSSAFTGVGLQEWQFRH